MIKYTKKDIGPLDPARFIVIQHRESGTKRLGHYTSLEYAEKAIKKTEVFRADTLCGLIERDSTPTEYSIWECEGFKRVR